MSTRPLAVVTGATNGLGRLAALDLARGGADLAVVARDPDKATALIEEVKDLAPEANVGLVFADMSILRDVRAAATQLNERYERIDILVNNAGVHAFSQRVTAEGLSEMTAVNYLAPWLLTTTLQDKLVQSAPARIVTVASEAAKFAKTLDPADDLMSTATYTRRESSQLYGRTKLMNIMFTLELGRRLAGTAVTVSCCDPGFNVTGLGRDLPFSGPLEHILNFLRIGDPKKGTGIIVRLATDPEATFNGYFSVKDAKALECAAPGNDEALQRDLWDTTATLVDKVLSTTR